MNIKIILSGTVISPNITVSGDYTFEGKLKTYNRHPKNVGWDSDSRKGYGLFYSIVDNVEMLLMLSNTFMLFGIYVNDISYSYLYGSVF